MSRYLALHCARHFETPERRRASIGERYRTDGLGEKDLLPAGVA